MPTTRRGFLKLSGAGLTALMLPAALSRVARAYDGGPNVLVVIYQRGGCDGLSLVAPQGDPYYPILRPNTTIQAEASYPLLPLTQTYRSGQTGGIADGFFSLHPRLADLMPFYDGVSSVPAQLAVIHGTGRTGSYSHFTAQDRMENADPNEAHPVGWLHRAVWKLAAPSSGSPETLMGVALDATGIQALRGPMGGRTLALDAIDRFELSAPFAMERKRALSSLYASLEPGPPSRRTAQDLQRSSGDGLFASLGGLNLLAGTPPENQPAYDAVGDAHFRRRLQDAARLIKDPSLGVRIVCIDQHGWDHHERLVSNMRNRASYLGRGLAAFYADLDACAANTVTLVMTEFGRTAWENGGVNDPNAGTDHGWGSAMLAIGGAVKGQRVLCRASEGDGDVIGWPGLAPGALHPSGNKPVPAKCQTGPQTYADGERDLEVTTDFRDVFAEVVEKHLLADELASGALVSSDIYGNPDAVIPPDAGYTRAALPDGGLFE